MKSRLLTVLASVIITACIGSTAVAEAQKVTGPDGIVIECSSARSELAKELLPAVSERLPDNEKRVAQIKETTKVINDKKEAILDYLADQLGIREHNAGVTLSNGPATDNMKKTLNSIPVEVYDQMIDSLPSLKHVRIWDVDEAKALLASGQTIPGLQLDQITGQITKSLAFQMGFTLAGGSVSKPLGHIEELNSLPVLVRSKDEKEALSEAIKQLDDLNTLYDILTPQMMGGCIHEAAEIGVISSLNLTCPYRRWFCDGMANYLAASSLEKFVSHDASQVFLKNYDPSVYDQMKDEVDLRYWKGGEYDELSPVKWSKQAENAAYAFATKEISGLAARHGAECIPAICKEIAKTKQPSEDTILDAISTVTKEDFRKTLDSYGTKVPKNKLTRFAIRGLAIGTTDPNSAENREVNQTRKLKLIKDGRHGVWVMIGYATPDPGVKFRLELVGPPKSDGSTPKRMLEATFDGKTGALIRGFWFPDDIDQPGKYTLKLYLEGQPYKDIDFEVVIN